MDDKETYIGKRVLEAMHNAVFYSETLFSKVQGATPRPAGKVLDFGAGDGLFVSKFRNAGLIVDCVEPDLALQAQLRTKAGEVYANTTTMPTATYDFAYTINVLEHIDAVDDACAELFRVLRPGGRLFVFVPAFEVLWTSLDDEVGHVRRFTRSSLGETLRKVGFDVQTEYFDSVGFPAALGVKLLEKLNMFSYSGSTIGFYDRYLFPVSRALDIVCKRIVGKNVIAIATKGA